jgi:hypothetical protein
MHVKESSETTQRVILLAGDALVLALMTVIGFASHDLLGPAGTSGLRMLTTFLPFLVAWLLVAPHIGAFNRNHVSDVRQLWRPFWAMILAAPLAAWLRGAWLGTPILPVFVAIVGGLNALALLVWRALYLMVASRLRRVHG